MARTTLESATASLGKALSTIDSGSRETLLAECRRDLRSLSLSVEISRSQRKAATALMQFLDDHQRAARGGDRRDSGAVARPQPKTAQSARASAHEQPGAYEFAERFARLLQSIESKEKIVLGSDQSPMLSEFVQSVLTALMESKQSLKELELHSDLMWFLRKAWAPARQAFYDSVDRGVLLPSTWLEAFVNENWLMESECALLPELTDGLIRRCEHTLSILRDRRQLSARAGLA
ncbi:MAG: hypothetical protein AAF196_12495 [Planctomycetota bacterium]